MVSEKTKVDSAKLIELQKSLMVLKKNLEEVNTAIGLAIKGAGETWKDFQYQDLVEAYKKYQSGVLKFEKDLEAVSRETLPPLIQAAEESSKISLRE